MIHFFDPTRFVDDGSIATEKQSVVNTLLDANAAYRHKKLNSDHQLIHTDDGRLVPIRDDEVPRSPAHPLPVPSIEPTLSSAPRTTSPSTQNDSSSGSSGRDSSSEGQSDITSLSSIISTPARPVSSDDIYGIVKSIWSQLHQATGRQYTPFDYTGPQEASSALFVFGADAGHLGNEMGAASVSDIYAGAALITIRLYRPWIADELSQFLPKSIRRIAVLEQIRRETTKWGPLLLDILTSLHAGDKRGGGLSVVGYQLGYLETSTLRQALNGPSEPA